jgi:multidrug efflux pump subunit AcrA (membrane-fusion protein)
MRPTPLLLCAFALGSCRRTAVDTIEATGTLDVVEVDVAPTVLARVERVLVSEGATVRAGDTLVLLTISTLRS